MHLDIEQHVQQLHDAPARIALVTAGAGTEALSNLLGVAGATRTLLEAIVPYSKAAMDEYLGTPPKKYVTSRTANLLAGRAYTRARWLESEALPSIGLACTATIITDRPKRGEHRAHIACWHPDCLLQYSIYLDKGARDRAGEENVVSRIMLNALAKIAGVEDRLTIPLRDADRLESNSYNFLETAVNLYNHNIDYFGVTSDGRIRKERVKHQAMLPGAFNPLHDGHISLLRIAEEILGQPVAFECAAVNVDKPSLEPKAITNRIAQFAGRYPVYVTTAPTYVEKARLFPNTTFVVGYDTAERIIHPRYYHNSNQELLDALTFIRDAGCQFLVAGRAGKDGTFRDIHSLNIPTGFDDLFLAIPADKFRKDISSTQLRATGQRGSR